MLGQGPDGQSCHFPSAVSLSRMPIKEGTIYSGSFSLKKLLSCSRCGLLLDNRHHEGGQLSITSLDVCVVYHAFSDVGML